MPAGYHHAKTDEERRLRLAASKKSYREKPETKSKHKAYQERTRRHRLERMWNYTLRREYGIGAQEYEDLLTAQEGKCAICHRPATDFVRRLAVDHCHETGKIRGLLCFHCNSSLGKFGDDIVLLERAANYLRRNSLA